MLLLLVITTPKRGTKKGERKRHKKTACFLCGLPVGAICEYEWSACHRCVLLLPLLQAGCTTTNITELLTRAKHCHDGICRFCCYYHPHRHYYYHHLKYKLPQNLARRVSPVFFQERLLRCYCCCCNARFACITHIVARRLEGSRPPQWRIIKRLFGYVGRTDGPPRLRPSDTAAQRSASRRKLCPAISAEGAGNAFGVFSSLSPPRYTSSSRLYTL